MKQGKIWGETEKIFNNGIISVHHLKIKKGGFSSAHSHKFKSNIFFIISGNLKLTIWHDSGTQDSTVIWPGESSEILPGICHKFEALTDVECLEIYETKLRGEDIERKTEGGLKS